MPRVVATADIHGSFPEIPRCDLLVIGGDVCPVDLSHDFSVQRKWLVSSFGPWLEEVHATAAEVCWIGGNHDFVCDHVAFPPLAEELAGTYLRDEEAELPGLRVYGTPWTPTLTEWAFVKSHEEIQEIYRAIPEGVDIILGHGPAHGILDTPIRGASAGTRGIEEQIYRVGPQLHVSGHIHEAYGELERNGVRFANVSHMTVDYKPLNPPMVFDL